MLNFSVEIDTYSWGEDVIPNDNGDFWLFFFGITMTFDFFKVQQWNSLLVLLKGDWKQ